ncbi:proton-coupled amino acid transporter-like protein pathetic isoform X2 [Rhodnius prolixus]|uniref:proton-coupled amino acid transporter-like protein pathetic isoform X2 n=1 Tax=Rhodnius prolixus TaxID=13249 RepID=UPI003D18A61E
MPMDNKGMTMEKMPSVISINSADVNMSSTLKLAENDVMQKNAKNLEMGKSDREFYNPFDYRDKTNATPDTGALLHLLKSSLGTGILAMPSAFKNGGLIFGIFGTIIVGYICTHCVHMLVRCSQLLSSRVKQPSLGFPETAEVAFKTGPEKYRKWAKFSWIFVKISLFATYYFGNTVYVVFIAKSFEQVIEHHTGFEMNIRIYILLLTIPLIPLGIIRTLKYLVPFSAMATAFIMFGLAITLYYTFVDLPDMETRHYITHVQHWPIFFSTVLFAMEGIGTVLPIENSMKTPEHFLGCPGVLNIAMSVVVVLYGCVGFLGYVKFGEETEGSITLNLPQTVLAEVVKVLVALSILFTYGLQFSVPSEIMWKLIGPKISENRQNIGYYLMRGVMIFGTVLVAIIIPDLSPFISLVGAVCFSILGLFCPAVIEAITYYEEGYGPMKIRLVKDIVIMLMALFALVSGSYISIIEIIEFYKK